MSRNGVTTRHKSRAQKEKQQKAYLTKRLLLSAAKRGIREAAEETMQVMGYVIIARNGWVVKKYADGRVETITPINH